MPETVIHMTCSRTHKVMQLKLTKGGDVRATILNGAVAVEQQESDEE
jgi:hypothetical protein